MSDLAERLAQTRSQISEECLRLNREEPTLIVVTKNHPMTLVEALYELGERNFGENRVQEATEKANAFHENRPQSSDIWHLIGQLQTNKVKVALETFNIIHSLDRESLLDELMKRCTERPEPLSVFIQVNLTTNPDRGGVAPESLLGFADRVAESKNLKLEGLMAVASLDNPPEYDFERIAKLSTLLRQNHTQAAGLSIGMSKDYLEALSFGATHLRIGTAITGIRNY